MPLPGYREQFMAQLLPSAAAGLDGVAVGAQRDHLLWVVRAALGEILDVVHIQDRASGIGDVLRLTRAARVLAVPFAAQQHGTARRLQAQDVHAYPRLAEPDAAIASTGSDPAQAAVLLFQRAPGYDHVAGRNLIISDVRVREPRISQDRVIVGVLKIPIRYRRYRRDAGLPRVPDEVVDRCGQAARRLVAREPVQRRVAVRGWHRPRAAEIPPASVV